MERRDWNLLVIAAAEGHPLSPVQLQKCLFILGKEAGLDSRNYYEFIAYNYGPFCGEVYDDARELSEEGFVKIRPVPGQGWSEYSATPDGIRKAKQLRRKLDKGLSGFIKSLVNWARELSFNNLVRAIYAKYPEYRKNSVFTG